MAQAMQSWIGKLAGRFVVLDGPDGSGKTTQFRRLAAAARTAGIEVCEVREPGGTPIGESIRKVLLEYRDHEHGAMDLRCEMLLFMASRAQLIRQRLQPALAAGQLVLADRFISSTLAYQGAAGGLAVEQILEVGKVALGEHWPDLVVIFDVDESTAAGRLSPLLGQAQTTSQSTSGGRDRVESRGSEFHRKVRQGFLDQAAADPSRHLVIDATADADAVQQRLTEALVDKTKLW